MVFIILADLIFRWGGGGGGGGGTVFCVCVTGGRGGVNGLLGISRIFQQPGLAIYMNDLCFCVFFWGVPQFQSDWRLSCDYGLDFAS